MIMPDARIKCFRILSFRKFKHKNNQDGLIRVNSLFKNKLDLKSFLLPFYLINSTYLIFKSNLVLIYFCMTIIIVLLVLITASQPIPGTLSVKVLFHTLNQTTHIILQIHDESLNFYLASLCIGRCTK